MFTYEGIRVIPKPSEEPRVIQRWARFFNFIHVETSLIAKLLKPLELPVAKRVLAGGQFVRDDKWKNHNGELTARLAFLNNRARDKEDIILDAHFVAISILRAAEDKS